MNRISKNSERVPPRLKTNRGRPYSIVLLLISLMGIGGMLIYVPSWFVQNYRAVQELGPLWARVYLVVVSIGGLLMVCASGYVVWRIWGASWRKRQRQARRNKNPSELSPAERQAEIAQNMGMVDQLQGDQSLPEELRAQLYPLAQEIQEKQQRQELEIVAFGTISSGKSSLLNALAGNDVFATDLRGGTTVTRNEIPWPGQDRVTLVDTPGLGEVDGEAHQNIAAEAAEDADLILLVLDGPLRQTEFALLELLHTMEKRVLICLNKQDWYSAADRDELLGQLAEQLEGRIRRQDILAVHAQPAVRTRIRVSAQGEEIEEQVMVPANIESLATRMMEIVRKDGKDLLLANLLLQSRGLLDEARERVQASIDGRAWQLVDKYTWLSSGAVAINPIMFVDIAAGVAVSAKMVVELARIYKQEMDLQAATQLLTQQGKNLVGAVSGYAVAEGAKGIASMVKAVPGVGYLAGGLLQGVIQAVITRWIGAIFIEYFRNEMKEPPGGMAGLAREQWQKVTSVSEIRKLVTSAREQFHEITSSTDS